MPKLLFAALISIIFFIVSFFFIHDYGISWDEVSHFQRAQGYLHYFLTGQVHYTKLSAPNRSFFQDSIQDGKFYIFRPIGGHPPLNGLLASLSNYFFYQELGWLGDVASYHLFNILTSTLLVFVVTLFASEVLGILPAAVVALSLITYPLFWAESKFNIKDPAEAAFMVTTIYAFIKSIDKRSSKWLILSIISFTLGLGTKFNIVFLPFIIIPYLMVRYSNKILKPLELFRQIPRSYLFFFLISPIFIISILYITWPTIWQEFPQYLLNVLYYYKDIGTGDSYQPANFYFAGFNSYPILDILYTAPPLTLILALVGTISAVINYKKFGNIFVLWLFLLLIPILRVTIPGSSIYGGVRQIMEFIPGLALVSGIGVWQLLQFIKPRFIPYFWISLFLLFLYPVFILYKLHPNQNVYFNSLIGGLEGAKQRNFPSWGNSLGNAYLQGVEWLNLNAEPQAKLTLLQGELQNAYAPDLRADIEYKKEAWSGYQRRGEYIMELVFNDTASGFHYAWEYVNEFLVPVYELKVEGVTILKIWKNDLVNTKQEARLIENQYLGEIKQSRENNSLILDFNQSLNLARIDFILQPGGCQRVEEGFIETSVDKLNWQREGDPIPYPQVKYKSNLEKNLISYNFAGKLARYVRLTISNPNSCGLSPIQVKTFSLK